MMVFDSFLDVAVRLALVVLSISLLITVFRVIRGPTLPDRILALDMLVAVAIGFLAVIGIMTGYTLYLDIAIALGLVGFPGDGRLLALRPDPRPDRRGAWPGGVRRVGAGPVRRQVESAPNQAAIQRRKVSHHEFSCGYCRRNTCPGRRFLCLGCCSRFMAFS